MMRGDMHVCVTSREKEANIQSQEDEGLVGLLAAAAYAGWGIEVARVLVVVLRSEDEGSQPAKLGICQYDRLLDWSWDRDLGMECIQVGENDVDEQHELAECRRQEGRDESWNEEDDGEDRLDY
jgi:hypothetical protein